MIDKIIDIFIYIFAGIIAILGYILIIGSIAALTTLAMLKFMGEL